ncbi:MAG: thiol reductant ABC exporter subunit CydD [Actinobacteria bacterium]|nr:thiol reductant ABC exporter subunit CydD [Actinomycetota bacterium]
MRPIDPRLLHVARSTRRYIVAVIITGVVTAVLVIVQARLLSGVIVDVSGNGLSWDLVSGAVGALALVFVARAVIAWGSEMLAVRASARAKEELRDATVRKVLATGPYGRAGSAPGEVATLVTRGIDGLDGYFARYLPQLVLAVIVPCAILLTLAGQDLLSALIVAVTIPLIPVFMILIGLYTKGQVERQWRTLAAVSTHVLDLIEGLPTLKIFGRAKEQAAAIRAMGDDYRSATVAVLRVSFLSSLALELLATLSIALVAVSVGLRLAEGQLTYATALFVLLLAPEAYLPLRLVGQHFHAAAEGVDAADRVFTILEPESELEVVSPGGAARVPEYLALRVSDASVRFDGRTDRALEPVSFEAVAGSVTALVGASGGGKTTLINAIMGFIPLTSGSMSVIASGGAVADLSDLDRRAWLSTVGWVPQRSRLIDSTAGSRTTIEGAIRLGAPHCGDDEVWAALRAAGIAEEVDGLPAGLRTEIQSGATGLSAGQLQRIALARALVRRPRLLLLDEPTAGLDNVSEAAVVNAVRRMADEGAIVIVVAHRPALVAIADAVVRIGGSRQSPASPESTESLEIELSAGSPLAVAVGEW